LDWVKTGMGSLYLGGFTNLDIELLTSPYHIPNTGERAINLNDSGPNGIGYVELDKGQLGLVVVSNVVLTPMTMNKFLTMKYDAGTNPVTLVLSKPVYKTGVVKGTFRHSGLANALTPITGVILQDANVARGYFMKKGVSTESGSFLLAPQ
jgi:hypothetical protein